MLTLTKDKVCVILACFKLTLFDLNFGKKSNLKKKDEKVKKIERKKQSGFLLHWIYALLSKRFFKLCYCMN